jgi:glycosyltransferase involved in cell wall biosynthesis
MTTARPASLVSVILPAWRDERHVEATLRSLYDQDHPAVEIIVVDDGASHPAARAIRACLEREDMRQRFPRIAHVEESDPGVSRAINRGLRESRGDYVNVLEPGDACARHRFSRLLNVCTEDEVEFAFARVEPRADAPGSPAAASAEADDIYSVQDDIEFFPTVGYALLRSHCAVSTGNLFFSRQLAEQVDGFRDLDCCYGWDFALRCLLMAEPVFVPETLSFYSLHSRAQFLRRQKAVARETESILKDYFFLCRNRRVLNPFAPSPAWGPFFQSFVQTSQYTRYLAQP